jgi:hypothetical protein
MQHLYKLPLTILVLTVAMAAGTSGMFRGTVVESPHGEKLSGRWIYVKGRNGMLRKVEISKAKVSYGTSVPKSKRERIPDISLKPGAEVRVTAMQDREGEWRASRIELLGSDLDNFDYELPPGHPPIDAERGANSKI